MENNKQNLSQSIVPATPQTPVRYYILFIGLLLSIIMMIPSMLLTFKNASTGFATFAIILHIVMFVSLSLPFVIIFFISRGRSWTIPAVTFGALFSILYAWEAYGFFTVAPQEVGYIGVVFFSFVDAVVVIPIGLLIIFIIKMARRN